MKTSLLMIAVAAGALSSAGQAHAQWYGAVDIGQHEPNDISIEEFVITGPIDAGLEQDWAGFVRVGRHIGEHWRVEAELATRSNEFGFDYETPLGADERSEGAIDARTLIGNVIYDFAPDAPLNPFLGAGLGIASFHSEHNGFDDDHTGLAWQVLAGGAWRIGDRLTIDATYRFIASELDTELVFLDGQDYQGHSLSFGLRHTF